MKRGIAALAGLVMLPLLSGAAPAQEEERYRLERTDDGYVRMDTRTGDMTLCRERSGELVCRPATEEEAQGEPGAATLRERLAALEARVEALEEDAGSAPAVEEEFEQTLGMMERFFRSFIDIVRGLEEEERQREQQQQAPGGESPPPGQT